ncbi:hypothetical protein [Paraburkholderia bannensis]|uniref:hypothetical protein n=1 Tax=Paraburkholderia bannensis TaxID=765414 RepID=UPI002AC31703|nr:hypothetical protein [Paraburkholderia bannensis]
MFAFVIMVAVAAFVPYVATPAVQHAVSSTTAKQQSQQAPAAPVESTAAAGQSIDVSSAMPAH